MNIKTILAQPIPDQQIMLEYKKNYRSYPLITAYKSSDEPLADIAQYGIAGQSYYSRPNATGQPLDEVSPQIYVRKSIAERLSEINYALQESSEITKLFGKRVELYLDEGVRTQAMQKKLYAEVFPRLIREQFPAMKASEASARRDQLIAKPSNSLSPSPHATGAAIDVKLRFACPELGFVPHSFISMGHQGAHVGQATSVSYFETFMPTKTADKLARRNRRILYWVMRGALLGKDTDFIVNPTEVWHWSHGDQMWAALTHAPCAFYGTAYTSDSSIAG